MMGGVATKPARRRTAGWIPDQHGAWAMLAVPLVVGVVLSGFAWTHLLLALTWFLGYFAFFAIGRWVKSHLKSRFLPPARAYTLAVLPLGVALVALVPALAWWVPVYLPLVAVSLWCSYRRKDRSVLNDGVTILAACLMIPVSFVVADVGRVAEPPYLLGAGQVWAIFAVVLAYFLGTVPYVKSMIRRRGEPAYRRASVFFHVGVGVVACTALALAGLAVWPAAVVLLVAAVRADVVPRFTTASPAQLGVGELAMSLAVTVVAIWLPAAPML
ncbi:YwiC-like protein [Paraoerskovia marina]|uniref:YwiC-like protein n=1 Tax=Paraoerskovia marina TaxID=545619 RepID=A0A1H1VU00_9CELL|nr:YwiC-like protein [Paraoerskovia marina]